MVDKILRRFYDSYPNLPLDPDGEQLVVSSRPAHTKPAYIVAVGIGAFFGTLGRYGLNWAIPTVGSWPMAIFCINILGAFLLGLLLESLLRRGKDEGERRLLRLLLGTGYLGAFTTYSSLAAGAEQLARHNAQEALAYVVISIVIGVGAAALGIRLAARRAQ